jgi:hypothetical protein
MTGRERLIIAVIFFFIVIGYIATTTKEPAPKQQTAETTPSESQERKTYWHVDRPLQAKSDDLLSRMGRVFERDDYHLGQKLDRELPNWRRLPVKDPIPVDENLTAEEVFAANDNHAHPPVVMFDLSRTPAPKDARKLSEGETLRLWGLRRIQYMASLTIYKNRCGYQSFKALQLVEDQFKKLPIDVQKEAMKIEIKGIESRPDTTFDGVVDPGGWRWFCKIMNDNINKSADHIFQTAMEGFLPIEGK